MSEPLVTFLYELEKLEYTPGGWSELFKSEAVTAPLEEKACAIANAACAASSPDDMDNPPFAGMVHIGKNTAVGYVSTASPHGLNAWERIIDNLGAG